MKYIKYITILFFIFVLFFVNNSSVSAQTCYTNTTSGVWELCDIDPFGFPVNCIGVGEGGSQEAYDCCVSAGTSNCIAPDGPVWVEGACWNGTVNCQSGATISLGQPINTFCSVNVFSDPMCSPPGSAQRETGCCGGNDEFCRNPEYTTYACCTAGTTESCQVVPGAEVYRTVQWSGDPTTGCWNAAGYPQVYYKSSYRGSNCYYTRIDHGDGDIENAWVCDWTVVCGQNVTVCSCVSNCAATAPTAPTLLSPSNGATVSTTQTSLQWNNSGVVFGTGCPVNNNQFEVYVGTSPASLALAGTVGSRMGSIDFT